MSDAEFEAVRAQPDALARAREATHLIAVYQQRSTELARLRRAAIEQAAQERGLTLAAVAAEIGLSKGRITQIRQTAPPAERGLFGIGPVTVAVPMRAMPGRQLPVISAEDTIAAERMTALLTDFGFTVDQYRIPVGGEWAPSGDLVAICGPKSSHVTADAIAADPFLSYTADAAGRWEITDKGTRQQFQSPMDDEQPSPRDIGYVGRLPYGDGTIFIVAGVHAIGSVGVIHYLARHAESLYQKVGDGRWSAVVASTHDGETITESELICPARRHA